MLGTSSVLAIAGSFVAILRLPLQLSLQVQALHAAQIVVISSNQLTTR